MSKTFTRKQEKALLQIGTVADMFTVLRASAQEVFPELAAVGLAVDSTIHDSPRHFAAVQFEGSKDVLIRVAPEIANLPEDATEGILMHEFGHIAAEWSLLGEPVEESYDACERQADEAAEEIFGVEIWYDGDTVQRSLPYGEPEINWSRPRPKGVR